MFNIKIIFGCIFASIVLQTINAKPQQGLTNLVDEIFNQKTSPRPQTGTTRRGFNVFVTPEPANLAQQQLKFVSINGREPCTCVRYHMCNPDANMITDDGSIDGFGLIDLRFGSADEAPVCEHPLDKCCGTNQTRAESLAPVPQEARPNRAKGCGIRNVGGIDFNLVGASDNDAGYGEFPWTVALLHSANMSYFCAGSLIHPRVVLTAIHCIRGRAPNSFVVRAGEWDTQTQRERLPFEQLTVSRVLTHPQFNPRNVAFNYALVILNSEFTLGDHINTVCLPADRAEPNPATTCFATGWGKDLFGAAGQFSVIMKRVPLPIVSFRTCQDRLRGTRLGAKFALDPSFICAGGEAGVDTCEGDGGAPLVCPIGQPSENRYVQSGIVSWGIGCKDNIPAAYANVALVRSWIDEQMLANGFSITSYTSE